MADNQQPRQITVLGVGNILLKDEGVGVRVVERLATQYTFPENVSVVDGGVLGVRLMGLVADSDVLIIVDAVRNQQPPGTLYRLADDEVPRRVLAKQSMHQMDLPEVLAMCAAIDKHPQVVVVGIEPEEMTTMEIELTPTIAAKVDTLVSMVLKELDELEVDYAPRSEKPSPEGLVP